MTNLSNPKGLQMRLPQEISPDNLTFDMYLIMYGSVSQLICDNEKYILYSNLQYFFTKILT